MPVEASLTALRRCVTLLAKDQAFREEIGRFTEQLAESGGGGGDPELFRRSFVEFGPNGRRLWRSTEQRRAVLRT